MEFDDLGQGNLVAAREVPGNGGRTPRAQFTQLGFECLSTDPRDACTQSLNIAQGFLQSLGLRYELDAMARRGLTYYLEAQGFELRCLELGAQQQIAGGGAYREGAGFAIGAERLLLALKAQGIEDCS